MILKGFQVSLGSLWGQSRVALGSFWGQFKITLCSAWGQLWGHFTTTTPPAATGVRVCVCQCVRADLFLNLDDF